MKGDLVGKDCFVAGVASVKARRLAKDLRGLGLKVTDSTSLAASPESRRAALVHAMSGVDVVVAFIAKPEQPMAFFELGVASALAKPTVIVTDAYATLPFDVSDIPRFTFDAIEENEEEFGALLVRLVRGTPETPPPPRSPSRLGPAADELLSQLHSATTETALVDVLRQSFDQLGVESTQQSRLSGKGRVDLLAWSDELTSLSANPLIIECKASLTRHRTHEAFAQVESFLRAARTRIALVVYLSGPPVHVESVDETGAFVFFVRADSLLNHLREKSLPETIAELAATVSGQV